MNAAISSGQGFSNRAMEPMPAAAGASAQVGAEASVIDNIARLIGAGKASLLIAEFGGGRLYIPQKPSPEDPLAQTIGYTAALRLASVFGGERVWLPNDAGRATRVRIAVLRAQGLSVSRVARRVGCSERYVYKVLAILRDEQV